jgi:membrane protease YdiL (CAAX protease family)
MKFENLKNNDFALNEKISNVILIFLLFVRLASQYLPLLFGSNTPNWYAGIIYILTTAIVWLNRHRLTALNIDRPFIVALLLSGVFYVIYLIQSVGIFVGIAVGLIYWAYQNNQLVFKNPVPGSKGTGLLILLTVVLALVPVLLVRPKINTPLDFQIFITTFLAILVTQLATIIFEEVLFRGALWAYIRNLGISEQVAFYIVAILFWVSHYEYLSLSSPYFFWIALPILSILLGLISWRSKSITQSTIGHFLFNFTSALIKTIF